MNSAILLKATTGNGNDDYLRDTSGAYRRERRSAAGIALWVFMGVATSLFALFLTAYVMRMESTDWSPIAMPPQLWLSTALLVAASILMHLAGARASSASWHQAYVLFIAGGVCAIAFICVQLWAWQQLLTNRVSMTGNPAASFFYLLTAMHGLHVAGGQIAWAASMRSVWLGAAGVHAATRIKLCARYWHFLLAVWLVLFGTLGWLTPEAVRLICGTG
ncbi:bb3-type cytochrome oxidase subunit III [Herbaspirillum sp. GCM10030257]|uniref:bb3-type cytochrome oxidase subunit III n=1 Tax=Herbaspirillum sp. GCM10030257 TaxID=3273393 RepID=UPI0036136EF1